MKEISMISPTSTDYEFTTQAVGIGTPDKSEKIAVSGAEDDAKHNFPKCGECEFATQAKGLAKFKWASDPGAADRAKAIPPSSVEC